MDNKKIKLVFIVQSPFFNTYWSIYNSCVSDTRFLCRVIIVPACYTIYHKTANNECAENIAKYLDSLQIPYEIGNVDKWREMVSVWKPDFVFFQSQYDIYRPKRYTTRYLKQFAKLVTISYGANLALPYQDYKWANIVPEFKNFWRVFVETDSIARQLKDANPGLEQTFQTVGYLKCDGYMDAHLMKEQASDWKLSRNTVIDNPQKIFRIIWKPRWTLNKDNINIFSSYCEFFLNLAIEHPHIEILILQHPLLGTLCDQYHDRMKSIFEKIASVKNITMRDDSDFMRLFFGADLLISGISSAIAEFLYLKKPVIYIEDNIPLNLFGSALKDICYVAQNLQEMSLYISKLCIGQDDLKKKREETVQHLFFRYNENASHFLKKLIIKEMTYKAEKINFSEIIRKLFKTIKKVFKQ